MFEDKKIRNLLLDEEKVEDLIRKYYSDIYKYCFFHLGNRETAQDITQEVFLKCKLRSNGMPVPLLRNCYSIFNGTKYR